MRLNEFLYDLGKMLMEAGHAKNTHSNHLEQLILLYGYDGIKAAIDHVEGMLNQLKGDGDANHPINIKFDGSPSIFCGYDPSDHKFFVATKGVFNKTPKIAKTPADIKEMYPEGDLRNKMALCLKHLPEIGIQGIIQGDLLFTQSNIFTLTDDGIKYIAFKPNTLVYAIPSKSELAERMKSAKLGIVFHTRYEGDAFETMTASFGIRAADMKRSKNVWFDDSYYKDVTGLATFTSDEEAVVRSQIDKINALVAKTTKRKVDTVLSNQVVEKNIEIYVNSRIKDPGILIGDPLEFLNGFRVWAADRIEKDIEKKQQERVAQGKEPYKLTDKVISGRREKGEELQQYINKNANTLIIIMTIYSELQTLKHLIMDKISNIANLRAFYQDIDGTYKVTSQEGFVSVTEHGMVKLVDRLEFSRKNFNDPKEWKK